MIIEAQSEKALATDEIRAGKSKDAASRLKGTAEKLRREASLIPANDERSAESLNIIIAEADEMESLAKSAEFDDANYNSKMMTQSFSKGTRSRKDRINPNN